MTANQINFQKYLEDVRTHRANEEISRRMASASESQAYASQLQAKAALANAAVNEAAQRANEAYQQAMVLIEQKKQRETERHNTALEQIQTYSSNLTYLSNQQNRENEYKIASEKNETSVAVQQLSNTGSMQRTLVSGGVDLITAFGNQTSSTFNTIIKAGADIASGLIKSSTDQAIARTNAAARILTGGKK